MSAESVHACVTSPPYFAQRDYGMPGQIGLEPTPAAYVAKMVEVFAEVRRVPLPDGVLWLNLGDTYSPSRKELFGIPWRVAFALQDDGWWLRGHHVWGKPNGMRESVTDRPGRGHEYVFLFSKSRHYWYDAEAVETAPAASTITRLKQNIAKQAGSDRANGGGKTNGRMKAVGKLDGANLRSVWWVPTARFRGDHFALMPDLVAEICIRSGCPGGGTVLDPFGGAGTTGLVGIGSAAMPCSSS